MQIGPLKYNKDEERIWALSLVLGILIGFPLGITTNYVVNLPPFSDLGLPPFSVTPSLSVVAGWITKFFLLLSFVSIWWWLVMVTCLLFLYRKRKLLNSWRDVGRSIFSTTFIPFNTVYVSIIGGVILPPLNTFLLEFYTFIGVYSICMLVFLPFVLLELYIIFPHLRTRMKQKLRMIFTHGYWRKAWRNPKGHKKMIIFAILVVIIVIVDVWRFLLS